jgi:hypothetical protein
MTLMSLGLHSCAKNHGLMQEEQILSSSHASIMRMAHSLASGFEKEASNKAMKLRLAFNLF